MKKYYITSALMYGFLIDVFICLILTGVIIVQPLPLWKIVVATQISLWMAVGCMWIALKLKQYRDKHDN